MSAAPDSDVDLDALEEAIEEARTTGDLRAINRLRRGIAVLKRWQPQDYQRPPDGEWWGWVFSGGAGSGKTDTGAWWLNDHMEGPPCDTRVPGGHKALVAGPTYGDAVTTCWDHPAGLSAHNPKITFANQRATWPSGAEAHFAGLHSLHDAELLRARAANCCSWWIDEGALARHLQTAIDILALRARLGPYPHGVFTSTPKPVPGWTYLLRQPDVIETHGSSYDNAYLPERVARRIRMYEGTAWGLQEIHGILVAYFEGALWRRERIDEDSVSADEVPELLRIMLGVDPSTWQPEFGDDPGTVGEGMETGIVAVGASHDPRGEQHAYTLGDWSGRYGTAEAARTVIDAYHKLEELAPVEVVLERNNDGGIHAAVQLIDPSVKFYMDPENPKRVGVHAAQGKRARAEPVSALADQHRMHHVRDAEEALHLLESQLVLWDPRESWSPDRLDAYVWAATALDIWALPAEVGSSVDYGPVLRRE